VTGPYLAVKNPELKRVEGPDDFVNFCLEKLIVLPVFEALPEMLFAVYVHVTVPSTVFSTIVVLSGFEELVPLTFTGEPLESAIVTLLGRLPSVTLLMPVTPVTLLVQLLKLCAVRDSFAVPGLAGFEVTLALKLDLAHLTPVVLVADMKKSAVVPVERLDLRTSPTFTLVPPTLPVVSTSTVAAYAGTADRVASSAVAAAARNKYLRISFLPLLRVALEILPNKLAELC